MGSTVEDKDGARAYNIGTAGHVDHGKSVLVRALTGEDPGRELGNDAGTANATRSKAE